MTTYAKHQIPYFWLIDPMNKTLDVLKLQSGRRVILETYAEHDPVKAEPFQEIAFELSNLWLAERFSPLFFTWLKHFLSSGCSSYTAGPSGPAPA